MRKRAVDGRKEARNRHRISIQAQRILNFFDEDEYNNMDNERKKARERRRKSKKKINTLKKQKEFREWNHKRWLLTVEKIPELLEFEKEMREKYIKCGYPNPYEHEKLVELDRAKKFNESYVKWRRLKKSNEIENNPDPDPDSDPDRDSDSDLSLYNDENVLDLSLCNEIGNDSDSISSLSD